MKPEPSDSRRFMLIALGAIWLMSFVYAFVAYSNAPHQTTGLSNGLSKTAVYLGWQAIAGLTAVAIYGVGLAWEKGSGARRLSRLPILIAFLQAVAIVGIVLWPLQR